MPGGPAEDAEQPSGDRALSGALLGYVVALVDVDVVAGERAAHQHVPAVVPFDETDLLRPARARP